MIENTVQSMAQITEDNKAIVSAIDQQSAATSEISKNVQIASQGTADVNVEIDRVKASTEETEKASNTVYKVVVALNERSSKLQESITSFIHKVERA